MKPNRPVVRLRLAFTLGLALVAHGFSAAESALTYNAQSTGSEMKKAPVK